MTVVQHQKVYNTQRSKMKNKTTYPSKTVKFTVYRTVHGKQYPGVLNRT